MNVSTRLPDPSEVVGALSSIEPAIRPSTPGPWKAGVVTRGRLRRTAAVYLAFVIVGLLPLVFGMGAGWRAAGIGLWMPGGGFIADGGWRVLLLLPTLLLFAVSVFAWFGAGAVAAPLLVWAGAAIIAGAAAGPHIWLGGPVVAALIVIGTLAANHRRMRAQVMAGTITAQYRASILDSAGAALAMRALASPAASVGELSREDLAAARYLYDRALQPVGEFRGFEFRDIFQTAAVRYQINYTGYALAHLQAQYCPSFHGYLSLAQRNLIEKYLQPRVWNYWVYESIWGHFNVTDWNPAAKDNIMLTGYLLPQLALYAATTGDQRYAQPGSLTFRLNDRLAWPHDVHSINQSIVDNMSRSAYCLYPCEPNWIYPGCNMRGMIGLASHDLAYGTCNAANLLEPFMAGLENDFTDASGSIIALRSSMTGIPLPFPAPDVVYAAMLSPFAPERGRRKWAVSAVELEKRLTRLDGVEIFDLPNDGIDFGNYKRGSLAFTLAGLMLSAREFGDERFATAAQNTLDIRCGRNTDGGVISYADASNLANLNIVDARISKRGSQHDLYTRRTAAGVLTGPLLSEAKYPDVQVAHAASDGSSLELVLYPDTDGTTHQLGISRLEPDMIYEVEGRPDLKFRASVEGEAQLTVQLSGRSALTIRPRTVSA